MASNNLKFSLKVCIASALLSPGIIILVDSYMLHAKYQDVWQSLQTDMLTSLALTIPVWLCFWGVTVYVNNGPYFYINKKFILIIVGTFLAFAPALFWMLYSVSYFIGFNVVDLMQPLIHAAIIMFAIVFLKLKPVEEKDVVYGDYKG